MLNNTQYLLSKLAEEAAELAQIAMKAQQFGLDSTHPTTGYTNLQLIELEFNDILGVLRLMEEEGIGEVNPNPLLIRAKTDKILRYRNHLASQGIIDFCN